MEVNGRVSSGSTGLRVHCGLRAGAIVCYDNSAGYLQPIVTACSTPGYNPPAGEVFPPTTPSVSDVQWLSCQSCRGASLGNGRLGPAACEVCYT